MCIRTLPDILFFPFDSVSIIDIDPKILVLVGQQQEYLNM